MRILLSGGGTGGHVYPILAVVSVLRQMSSDGLPITRAGLAPRPSETNLDTAPEGQPNLPAGQKGKGQGAAGQESALELLYVGETGGIEESLAQRAGIPFRPVATGQIRGRAPWVVARNLMRMGRGARQCVAVLRQFDADAVLVTGGYVAAPVAWAAWRQHVPLLTYLPDLVPGLAIRLTSRLATAVAVSFEEVAPYFPGKAVVTGYPVRPELLSANQAEARAALNLDVNRPVLLAFGGSRGRSINQALVAALPQLLPHCQVLHISGQLDWPWVAEAAAGLPDNVRQWYHPHAYLHEEMVQALAAADLAIARAGASTLGEFPAVGLPSILVPYPYAGQHQEANAQYLARRGAAVVLADRDLGAKLAPTIVELFDAPGRLAEMARASQALARPDAAWNIALALAQLAGGLRRKA